MRPPGQMPSAGADLPPFVVDRHLAHFAGRRLFLLGRAQAEVVEDARDGQIVGDVRDDLQRASTLAADEGIDLVHLRDQARPARGATTLLRNLIVGRGAVDLGG